MLATFIFSFSHFFIFISLFVQIEGEFHFVGLVFLFYLGSKGEHVVVHFLVRPDIEDGLSVLHELVTHLFVIPIIIKVAVVEVCPTPLSDVVVAILEEEAELAIACKLNTGDDGTLVQFFGDGGDSLCIVKYGIETSCFGRIIKLLHRSHAILVTQTCAHHRPFATKFC